uniref:Uncharacterized protein n=1 Tax=Anopheles atroparvus TaxID=41427 RepID=A0A182J178_ANOAO
MWSILATKEQRTNTSKVASSGCAELSTSSSPSTSAILLATLRAVTDDDGTSSLQAAEGSTSRRTTTATTTSSSVPSSIVLDPSTPVLILDEAAVAAADLPTPQQAQQTQHQQLLTVGVPASRTARDISSSSVMTVKLQQPYILIITEGMKIKERG